MTRHPLTRQHKADNPSTISNTPLAALGWLIREFPHTFFAWPQRIQPLKVGIHHELRAYVEQYDCPYSLTQLRRALYYYTRSNAYRQALIQLGAKRMNLQGEPGSDVSESHVAQAKRYLARKRKGVMLDFDNANHTIDLANGANHPDKKVSQTNGSIRLTSNAGCGDDI